VPPLRSARSNHKNCDLLRPSYADGVRPARGLRLLLPLHKGYVVNKKKVFWTIALGVAVATLSAPVIGSNSVYQPAPSQETQTQLNSILTEQLAEMLASDKSLSPAQQKSRSRAWFDYATGTLTIDLGKEFIPKDDVSEDEDLRGRLAESLATIIQDSVTVKEIKFLYNGKSAYFYHPSQLPRPEPSPVPHARPQ